MKKILFPIFLFFTACDSIEDPEVYDVTQTLSSPAQITLTEASPTSLSFEWSEVANAVQYGYTLIDATGKNILGGTTNETSKTFTGLTLFSSYTIKVNAMPAVGNGAMSAATELAVRTPFYDQVVNVEGAFTSYLLNSLGKTYTVIINEDRSGADYKDGWHGVFTLARFYEYADGSLVFTVNRDGSITILNATDRVEQDGTTWAMVSTGIKMPATRKTVYIDEAGSTFDITSQTLSLVSKFSNSAAPVSELFRW